MAAWSQIEDTKAHVAYAVVGVFSAVFSLLSLFIKERLYIGESSLACVYGLIVGPHCLNWFNPTTWGNSDSITLEITRIVLCLQIFAVAVELPRKYMKKHWLSITLLLGPVMTAGWLLVGLFVWILIPGLNFPASLLISACITATDPILAQSVVSGKFAQRVPGHLRNLLSAESGCNDGMAFPFVFLSLELILHPGDGREIVKNWICITILYECIFGVVLGVFIGYVGRRCIRFAKEKNLIDRESFLSFYIFLSFCCAGFGSTLGVDDLLVSFAAGTAFAWDGWFSEITEETKVSTVIELVLNYAYFVYFGAIIPWEQFNNGEIGTNVWRLIILSIVVIFLRRIPSVLVMKPLIPDIKSWREALFVGHFGPIGVGAVFAAILSRSALEASVSDEETPLRHIPPKGTKHWEIIANVWPITCFFIVTSIIVHGSSVAVITLGRHLNTITLTKTFTAHTTFGGKSSWMSRLPNMDTGGRPFSLQRVDTNGNIVGETTISEEAEGEDEKAENSGFPFKHFGSIKHRSGKLKYMSKLKRKKDKLKCKYGSGHHQQDDELNDLGRERLQLEREAQAGTFALSGPADSDRIDERRTSLHSYNMSEMKGVQSLQSDQNLESTSTSYSPNVKEKSYSSSIDDQHDQMMYNSDSDESSYGSIHSTESPRVTHLRKLQEREEEPDVAYATGDKVIIENRQGEILDEIDMNDKSPDEESYNSHKDNNEYLSKVSSHASSGSKNAGARVLKRVLSPINSIKSSDSEPHKKSRFHAYKVGNILIIENEEGEVLRRYRIKPQEESNNSAAENVIAKTLSKIGISRNRATSVSSEKSTTQKLSPQAKLIHKFTPPPLSPQVHDDNDNYSQPYNVDGGIPDRDSENDNYEESSADRPERLYH